ncbi:PorT family protein [Pedobacter sp. KBW06]|jgi:hypothetical protein|uniref:porin family protein n=1 Tax=Pedobacter sp. KBW06 TaxID=2153359 RepID=UPI000F5B3BE0|nr:porin family protein [Pedobacter sp. KBW06]RQO74205.1 PorT family protein [Pedobacter sp. KBW06]
MKKLLLSTVMVLSIGAVKAQKIELIPKAGISISKQSISNMNGEKNKVGFTAGLGVNFQVAKSDFSIQPELNYVSEGTKIKNGNITVKQNLNYLELPVLAKYSFGPVYVNAGPSISLLLSDKDKLQAFYGGKVQKLDFGIQMGAGVAIPAGPGKFIVDGRYALGLTDLSKAANKVKNRGIIATIGYAIPL